MNDSVGRGVSSAQAARQHQQDVKLSKAQEGQVKEAQYLTEMQAREAAMRGTMIFDTAPDLRERAKLENVEIGQRISNLAASAQQAAAQTRLLDTQRDLTLFDIPAARNRANAADTLFGRYITPFIPAAESARRMLGPSLFGR